MTNTCEQTNNSLTGGQTPVQIQIPKGLEALAKRYLANRQSELPVFQDLKERSDFDQIRRLSHNLKGTGTSYGFPDISRLGSAIETASKSRNLPEVSTHLVELSAYVQAAVQQLG